MISFIVAMDESNAIGVNNQLPWHLPADLAYFKKVTMGHPIIMGRKTYESIGRPLPGRENIVITKNMSFHPEGITVVHSIEEAVDKIKDAEAFIIGGATIFEQSYAYADRLYVTHIHEKFPGDTFFPAIDSSKWQIISKEKGIKDEKNPYDYEFVVYEKIEA